MGVVRIEMLGGFRIDGPAGGWSGLIRPLDVELAYLLALDPDEPMTLDAMGNALWPGMSVRWTADRLHELRGGLRGRLGAEIVTSHRRGIWELDRGRLQCDLWELWEQPRAALMFGTLSEPQAAGGRRYERARARADQARQRWLTARGAS